MALTPEEVVNQKFTITKFRDGYDLDQVDDFLDGMVEQLRQDDQEKTQLKADLEKAQARIAELETELEGARKGSGDTGAGFVTSGNHESRQNAAEQTIVVDAKPEPEPEEAKPDESTGLPDAAAVKSSAMLQLALELHDKYIHEGEAKRDELIKKAEETSTQLVSEAQKKRADEVKALETEQKDFATRIQELREFESEYRNTLSSYIQAQLRDLEGSPEPKGAPRNFD